MEKVIAQLDSIVTMSPHESFSDANTEISMTNTESELFGDSTSATVEKVLEVCQDQSQRIRQLNHENLKLWDAVRQLKLALNYSHELHNTANADRKAACSALMELERQLEMALKEKKGLEDGLQKASKLLEENRNKSLMDNRKLEQTQAMYDELKGQFDAFKRSCTCRRSPSSTPSYCRVEGRPIRRFSSKLDSKNDFSFTKDAVPKQYEQQLAQKNKEINEMSKLSQQQTEIILKQGQEIANLQGRIEQLSGNIGAPLKEENSLRTFFRRSFSTRRKKTTNAH